MKRICMYKFKFFILLVSLQFAFAIRANCSEQGSQITTFEQGKTWCLMIIGTYYPNPGEVVGYDIYTIDGTTIMDEQSYCKVSRQWIRPDGSKTDASDHEFFVRECDGKIYRKSTFDMNEPEELYFDCNMKEGDTNIYGYVLKKIEMRAVDGINGMELRHYLFGGNSVIAEYIEGVGYTDGHWFDLLGPTGSNAKLVYCKTVDGKFLYGSDIQVGVSKLTSNRNLSSIYDLQGQQLQREPTHGVFIKDGSKWVK